MSIYVPSNPTQYVNIGYLEENYYNSTSVLGRLSLKADKSKMVKNVKDYGAVGDGLTDDTSAIQAARDAASDHGTVHFPPGSYVCGQTTISDKNQYITGDNAKIINNSEGTCFRFLNTQWGTSYTVSSYTNTTNADGMVCTVLTVASDPTSEISVDDYVKVYSEDNIPEGAYTQSKMGEFARVAAVDSTTITLSKFLDDDNYYTTIKVCKLTPVRFGVEGLRFTTVTDNIDETGVLKFGYITMLNGVDCYIRNIHVIDMLENAIDMISCYRYQIDGITSDKGHDDVISGVNTLSYLILDSRSECGVISNIVAGSRRHIFTTSVGGAYSTLDYGTRDGNPHCYGRSRNIEIINCKSSGHCTHPPFSLHHEAKHISFKGCVVSNSNWIAITATGISGAAFGNRACYVTFENCQAINCNWGFYFQNELTRKGYTSGDYRYGQTITPHHIRIINCAVTNVKNCAVYVNTVSDLEILDCQFSDVQGGGSTYGNLLNFEPCNRAVIRNCVFTYQGGDSGSKAFVSDGSSNISMENCKFNLIEAYNSSGQITNYNQTIIRCQGSGGPELRIINCDMYLSVPFLGIFIYCSNTSQKVIIDGLRVVYNPQTSITCSDAVARDYGLSTPNDLGENIVNNGVTANVFIRGYTYRSKSSTIQSASSAMFDRTSLASGSFLDDTKSIKYRADPIVTARLSASSNITASSVIGMKYDGQQLVIYNTGSSTITIPHNTTSPPFRMKNGLDRVLNQYETITLLWDQTNSRYVEMGGNGIITSTSTMMYGGSGALAAVAGTATKDVILGPLAGTAVTDGQELTLVGYNAGNKITTGLRNSACGTDALSNCVTGSDNSAFGRAALKNCTGIQNTGIGVNAGVGSTSAGQSVYIGYNAGLNYTASGGSNVILGMNSFTGPTSTASADNVIVGRSAATARTSYTQCTLLGRESDCSGNGYSNSSALGYQATCTESNQVVLGNSSTYTKTFGMCYNRTAVSSTPYNATDSDHIIGVTLTGVDKYVVLPTPTSAKAGKVFIVKSEGGDAPTHPLSVSSGGGKFIDGATYYTITTIYGVGRFYSDGTDYWSF